VKLGIISFNCERLDLSLESGSESVLLPVLFLSICLISTLSLLVKVLIECKDEVTLKYSRFSMPAKLCLQLVLCEHFFFSFIIYIIITIINCY
jgi:hypothetical protein